MKVGIAFMVIAIFTGIINHLQTTRKCVPQRMEEEDKIYNSFSTLKL